MRGLVLVCVWQTSEGMKTRKGSKWRKREKEKFYCHFFPMNFNAQHWSPSRILGSHLLEEKKVMRNAVLCSLLLHGEMLHVEVGQCLLGRAAGWGVAQDVLGCFAE